MPEIEFNTSLSEEDKQAQFELGKACFDRKDYDEAIEFLREPAMQGHIEAQFYLGRAYTQQSFSSHAIRWLTKAAKQEHPKAQFYLGEAYFYGEGVVLDYAKALELYQQAEKQGNEGATNRLTNDYDKIKQISITQEYTRNVELSKLSNNGKLIAKYNLAIAFEHGEGVLENPKRAIDLWHEAAELGHAKSQYRLGVEYSKKYSKFVSPNDEKAIELWHKAAEQGHIEAQYCLGKHFYDENNTDAIAWWQEAAEQGHLEAQYYLGSVYYNGWKTGNPNQAQAIVLWQKAAEQGHITAQYNLGIAYKNGLGVTENYKEALQWFHKVAEHNKENDPLVISAQYRLGTMYKDGLGCSQQDYQEAKRWFRRAYADKNGNVLKEKLVLDENDIEKGLIETVRKSAQEALEDIAKLEEKENAKKELEDIMAMFAHKFRGPLLNIQYNAQHENQKTRTLKAVQTMTALLDIFSIISSDDIKLREKILLDKQGNRTLITVFFESLSLAIPQVLIAKHMVRIQQHYLSYAKKTEQIPSTATWEQLSDNYLDILEKLQVEWENSFMELEVESDDLTEISMWIQERFFPIQILGFENNPIRFKHYGTKELILIIVMTEMLLNSIKYYRATTMVEPIIVRWKFQQDRCLLTCENPTTQKESDSRKGTHKGQSFLNMIARKLEGSFSGVLKQNRYIAEFNLPRHLLIKEKK